MQLKQKSTAGVSNGILRNLRTATSEKIFFLRGAASSEEETGGEERAVTLAVSFFQGQLFIKS